MEKIFILIYVALIAFIFYNLGYSKAILDECDKRLKESIKEIKKINEQINDRHRNL